LATLLSGRYIQIHVLPLSFIADSLTSAGRPVSNVTIDKYLGALTLDFETNDHNGIRQHNAIDWMLGKEAP